MAMLTTSLLEYLTKDFTLVYVEANIVKADVYWAAYCHTLLSTAEGRIKVSPPTTTKLAAAFQGGQCAPGSWKFLFQPKDLVANWESFTSGLGTHSLIALKKGNKAWDGWYMLLDGLLPEIYSFWVAFDVFNGTVEANSYVGKRTVLFMPSVLAAMNLHMFGT